MFSTKVIHGWLYSEDYDHLFIVTYYFQSSASWKKITISDITDTTQNSENHRDPMYVLHGVK